MGIICASEHISDLQTPENDIDVVASTNAQDTSVLKENSTSAQAEQTTPAKTNTQPAVKNKIKTKVEADQKAVKYKKSTYFKVKVEDRYDDDTPIEHHRPRKYPDAGQPLHLRRPRHVRCDVGQAKQQIKGSNQRAQRS
jgi:hypothetical protein